MKRNGEKLYLRRKLGAGMGLGYTVHALVPALLVLLITAILVFSYVFISSMTSAIDRMIMVLGSGTISAPYDLPEGLPSSWKCDYVKGGDGILYTAGGETLVHLKGVEEEYFQGERGEVLKLKAEALDTKNTIILSSTLAEHLDIHIGDRMTLLLYEVEKDRTRPLLMTVSGIFTSGYAQLDRYLAYVPASLLSGDGAWEILLSQGEDLQSAMETLEAKGAWGQDYRTLYASLYMNVRQSVSILYVILLAVAVLAAFFSVDVALVYQDRDRRDIASLRLLGLGEKRIKNVYVRMTISSVAVAGALGTLLGLLLGLLSPRVMDLLSRHFPTVVENYIASFSLSVPILPILGMLILLVVASYLSLMVSLRSSSHKELSEELKK